MIYFKNILFTLIFLLFSYHYAQNSSEYSNQIVDLKIIAKSSIDQVSEQYELLTPVKLGFLLFGSGFAFIADKNIRKNLELSNWSNEFYLKIGHSYGDFYYNLYLSGAVLITGLVTKNQIYKSTGKALLESLIAGVVTSVSVKYIFGRSRPYDEKGVLEFNWFETDNRKNSLPSGHVITAFATSTVISHAFNNDYVSIILYGLAGLTTYQRIASDNHWFSDVFIGAALGYFIGEYFSLKNLRNNTKDNSSVIPFVTNNKIGMMIQINF